MEEIRRIGRLLARAMRDLAAAQVKVTEARRLETDAIALIAQYKIDLDAAKDAYIASLVADPTA